VAAVKEGHYHQKQLGCKSAIISWSHRSRFDVGLHLLGPSPRKLLDYGCGDGTFLVMAADRIQEGCGADIAVDQVEDCRKRLDSIANLRFCTIGELKDGERNGEFDVVTCMETLEHCTSPIVEVVLRDLARLVCPAGRVIISVPIEIGPTFLIKSIVRRLAAWRGLSDYRHYETYSFRDALRMIFARSSTELERPTYGGPEAAYHSHFGFNWRALRRRAGEHLTIERTLFSPLGMLGGWASSQAWFVCRPKGSASVGRDVGEA
jgi:SAM-dependent methyltransferase